MNRSYPVASLTFAILALTRLTAAAEMGPCKPNNQGVLICGEGNGAARVISATTSPSKRLALAWRLANAPPTVRPSENDADLETLIVRLEDGAILAKSHGLYWNVGERTARGRVAAGWSPDSRFLVRTTSIDGERDAAELFVFGEDDGITGPFDLVEIFDSATRAQMGGITNAETYALGISYMPPITIDDRGLIHASVYMARASDDGPIYNLTAQVGRTADSLTAEVQSISKYSGPYISVTVH